MKPLTLVLGIVVLLGASGMLYHAVGGVESGVLGAGEDETDREDADGDRNIGLDRLPDGARAQLEKRYPGAPVTEVAHERRVTTLWVVEVDVDGEEHEIFLTPDGRVVEVSREIALDNVPEATRAAIDRMAAGNKVNEVERRELSAQLDWVDLPEPRAVYEAEVEVDGRDRDVVFDERGEVDAGVPLEADD